MKASFSSALSKNFGKYQAEYNELNDGERLFLKFPLALSDHFFQVVQCIDIFIGFDKVRNQIQ